MGKGTSTTKISKRAGNGAGAEREGDGDTAKKVKHVKKRRPSLDENELDPLNSVPPKVKGKKAKQVPSDGRLAKTPGEYAADEPALKNSRHNTTSQEGRESGPSTEKPSRSAQSRHGANKAPDYPVEPRRKGRSSNTEAGFRAPTSYKETKTRKLGHADQSQYDRQPAEEPGVPSSASLRRGRSSNTEAELQAINYKETKSLRRKPILEVQPQSKPSKIDSSHGTKKRGNRLDLAGDNPALGEPATSKSRGRASVGSRDIQMSSKLTPGRSNGKTAQPVQTGKLGRDARTQTANHAKRPKSATQRSNSQVVENVGDSETQGSKNSSGQVSVGRKRKNTKRELVSHLFSYYFAY